MISLAHKMSDRLDSVVAVLHLANLAVEARQDPRRCIDALRLAALRHGFGDEMCSSCRVQPHRFRARSESGAWLCSAQCSKAVQLPPLVPAPPPPMD